MKVRARSSDPFRATTVADDGTGYRELTSQVPHPLHSGFTLRKRPCDSIAVFGHRMLIGAVVPKAMRVGQEVRNSGGLT